MQPWAVFLDIDGTLWRDGRVSERVKTAITEAQAQGHRVFINTGRSFSFIPAAVLDVLPWDGVVAGVGADVRIGGKQVFHRAADMAFVQKAAAFFWQRGRVFMAECEESVLRLTPPGHPEIGQPGVIELHTPEEWEAYGTFHVSKVTVPGQLNSEEIAALQPQFVSIQHPTYAEAGLFDCHKGTGVLETLKALSIPVERSMAIGDSKNDWDMMAAVGLSVAMGNADEETKARCHVVAPSVSEDGVAWAIEQYLL